MTEIQNSKLVDDFEEMITKRLNIFESDLGGLGFWSLVIGI